MGPHGLDILSTQVRQQAHSAPDYATVDLHFSLSYLIVSIVGLIRPGMLSSALRIKSGRGVVYCH